MTESATKEGTTRYAQRFAGRASAGHFRESQRLVLSSIGIGTYLGQPDTKTDEGYAAAIVAAVENGINVIDAAINYRFQRSERSIGAAIRHRHLAGRRLRIRYRRPAVGARPARQSRDGRPPAGTAGPAASFGRRRVRHRHGVRR